MITTVPPDPDFAAMMPDLAALGEPLRKQVIKGLSQLNRSPIMTPDASNIVGVVLADDEAGTGAFVSRKRALALVSEDGDFPQNVLARLGLPGDKELLLVLIITPARIGMVEVPIDFVPMQRLVENEN